MTDPIYVTEVADREPKYMGGLTVPLPLFDSSLIHNGTYEWWKQFNEKTSFTFKSKCFYNSNGGKLFNELGLAIEKIDSNQVKEILPKMKKYCQPDFDDLEKVDKWSQMSIQMPGDWGPSPKKKDELKQLITSISAGTVLEAMCGFTSLFENSKKIKDVIALDYCREGLLRYDYPNRKRILYDLDKISNGEKINFFDDNCFDTIGVFFGIDYLKKPAHVHKEFNRILKKNGRLLVVGGTEDGYKDMLKRYFDPAITSSEMESAGFKTTVTQMKSLKRDSQNGEYYLVEGIK